MLGPGRRCFFFLSDSDLQIQIFEEWIATMENCIVTQSRLLIKQWSFGFIESSPLTRSKIHEKLFWFHTRVLFSAPEGQLFYWSIMTAVDSIKCRCAHSGMTGQVGGFQNPGVCLQAFPSFLPSPPPFRSFTCAFIRAVFDSHSSFFVPTPHGNACYAG